MERLKKLQVLSWFEKERKEMKREEAVKRVMQDEKVGKRKQSKRQKSREKRDLHLMQNIRGNQKDCVLT